MPQATDWYDYSWFPRIAYAGIVPYFEPEGAIPSEVRTGARALLDHHRARPGRTGFIPHGQRRLARACCPVPEGRRGDHGWATCTRVMEALRIKLPPKAPRLFTDGRNGKMNPTEPVMHTVLIEPDEDRVSILWRGSAPALQAVPAR
ncbi:MAG: DUF2169 domain-containing protein [Desulfobacterales bacterium]|nr:DUF2169 domain-containing protein [Desulfobacterales bacterium]